MFTPKYKYEHAVAHLLYRTRMGVSLSDFRKYSTYPLDQLVDLIFEESKAIHPLKEVANPRERLVPGGPMRKEIEKESFHIGREAIVLKWLEKLALDPCGLREKMTFFWHGHFCAFFKDAYPMQELNNICREHALGNFRTLLHEVIRSPAIINYLDINQNIKGRPNENFARELMELFTMGEGNYSERDVREIARAFTGWHTDGDGIIFQFNKRHYDDGIKQIFGKTGNFGGDDVVDLILEKPATAKFIVGKIYRAFVNPKPHPDRIAALAESFHQDYDLGKLMKTILLSDWFYAPENHATIIKSPTELIAGVMGALQGTVGHPDIIISALHRSGQIPFHPPSVGGWPGGNFWINPVTLPVRLEIPSRIAGYQMTFPKPIVKRFEQQPKFGVSPYGYAGLVVNWDLVFEPLDQLVDEEWVQICMDWLMVPQPLTTAFGLISEWSRGYPRKERAGILAVLIMSLPEYQLS